MKNKFMKTLMLTGSLSLLLAACGNDTAEDTATDEAATDETAEVAGESFEGTADGHNGELVATVTFDGEEITSIEVDHSETEGMTDEVFSTMKDQIVENNSTDVETVSGATVSSEALQTAVEDAASQAGVTLN